MPPKQKEARKGPLYKVAAQLKDLVPAEVKEPPREPIALKYPYQFGEAMKNTYAPLPIFEDWPPEEGPKAQDFAGNRFIDPLHMQLVEYIRDQRATWKPLHYIEDILKEQYSKRGTSKSIDDEKVEDRGMVIVYTSWRTETEEEMQSRMKIEAYKAEKAGKDKKKGKKEEPKNEGPQQVSYVRLNDVVVYRHFSPGATWIGSQLQLLKQSGVKDVHTGEAMWKKIYPQENGAPVVSPSGKYWVKLFHLGRTVKVEVDDTVPVDEEGVYLLPYSAHVREKWPLLLTKALFKYLFRAAPHEDIVGSGLVVYALTGMLSHNISLAHFKDWAKVQSCLLDDHYLRKTVLLTCFAKRPYIQMQPPILAKEEPNHSHQPIHLYQNEEREIIQGYSYHIGDYFGTGAFNMAFAQEKSYEELNLKHSYYELCKTNLTGKNRYEKLEFRHKKKYLKEKLAVYYRKRLDLISRPTMYENFVKILAEVPLACEYSQKYILLAKKCIVNGVSLPPNYDIPAEKEEKDFKSMQSVSIIRKEYTKEESNLAPDLEDFSALDNVTHLLPRPYLGVWVKDRVWTEAFQYMQIFYDPSAFYHKLMSRCDSKRKDYFTTDESKEFLVVEGANAEKVTLLFGFGFQRTQPYTLCYPYCLLQKFDFSNYRVSSYVMRLDRSISSEVLSLGSLNSVFRVSTISKGNYNYWVSSTVAAKFCSLGEYLTEYEGYSRKNIILEHNVLYANACTLVQKVSLRQKEGRNALIVQLNNVKEEVRKASVVRVLRMRYGTVTGVWSEGVLVKDDEGVYLAGECTQVVLYANTDYVLQLYVTASQNIAEGTMELVLLCQYGSLEIEAQEQVEPVKYLERYQPNQYGVILRERMFTAADNHVTLAIRIVEGLEQPALDKKPAKKGGKEEPTAEVVERPLESKRKVLLRVSDNGHIIYEETGLNGVFVGGLWLRAKKEYEVEMRFDLRDWPYAQHKNIDTDKIYWTMVIASQESVALVRDTKQEDRERTIRKSWEENDLGRAERAKKTRRRYLLYQKKAQGLPLTEEEEAIVNAPRLTRKQIAEEEKKAEYKKGGKAKKEDKKAAKDLKKYEIVYEKVVVRDPPKSIDNFTTYVKEFLYLLYRCEVRQQLLEGDSRIRSDEYLKAIGEGALMARENRVGRLIRNIYKKETIKIKEKERKDYLVVFFEEAKAKMKHAMSEYFEWRAQDVEKERTRVEKEKQMVYLVSQYKAAGTEAGIKKMIEEYSDIEGHNKYLIEVVEMVRKNIKIQGVADRITVCLQGWDVDELKSLAVYIKKEQIYGIDRDLFKQMNDLLEEADKNPTLIAEKQAEAKKTKKGGKK